MEPLKLSYASPVVTPPRWRHVRFWGAFLLVGAVSVPVSLMGASLYFHEQELLPLGGIVLTTILLLLSGVVLAFAHTISPKWFSSPLAAASFAAIGPSIGIIAFYALMLKCAV